MRYARGLFAILFIVVIALAVTTASTATAEGQMMWAVHVSLAPTWFDPAETSGIITPFLFLHDKAMYAPLWLNAGLHGVGPRVEESGFGLIPAYAFSAPYEDLKLKAK